MADDVVLDPGRLPVIFPVGDGDIPMDVSITLVRERAEDPRVLGALAERASEPGPRIDANDLLNAALRFLDIGDQSAVRQVGQRRVRVRMVADQVPCSRDRSGYIWVGAGPAPLDEEGRGHLARGKQREDPLGCAGRALAATGMFGVKGQGDAQITHAL